MASIVRIEPTPNPMAHKLVIDQPLTRGVTKQYNKKDDAFDFPLAQKIFDIHGVQSVFILDNFITITKTSGGIWDFILFMMQEALMAARDITPIGGETKVTAIAPGEFTKLSHEEKLAFIDQVMDETIRPGLARDGGGLQLIGLEGDVLQVKYQGACGSCPSSTAQTLSFISNMLQNRVDPSLQVIPV